MHTRHTKDKVCVLHFLKTSFAKHFSKHILRWELANGLHQILIRVLISGNHFSKFWNHMKRIQIVQLAQSWISFDREEGKKESATYANTHANLTHLPHFRKLQTKKSSSMLQNAVNFLQNQRNVCAISNSKRHGHTIDAIVRESNLLRVDFLDCELGILFERRRRKKN